MRIDSREVLLIGLVRAKIPGQTLNEPLLADPLDLLVYKAQDFSPRLAESAFSYEDWYHTNHSANVPIRRGA